MIVTLASSHESTSNFRYFLLMGFRHLITEKEKGRHIITGGAKLVSQAF